MYYSMENAAVFDYHWKEDSWGCETYSLQVHIRANQWAQNLSHEHIKKKRENFTPLTRDFTQNECGWLTASCFFPLEILSPSATPTEFFSAVTHITITLRSNSWGEAALQWWTQTKLCISVTTNSSKSTQHTHTHSQNIYLALSSNTELNGTHPKDKTRNKIQCYDT